MLEVCCALIIENKQLLAVQRGHGSDHVGQWEFPGGKIEPGESAVSCIKREIMEELAVLVEVHAYLLPVVHDYGFKQIKLYPFVCTIEKGKLELKEHKSFRWIEVDSFDILPWQEADQELIQRNFTELINVLEGK